MSLNFNKLTFKSEFLQSNPLILLSTMAFLGALLSFGMEPLTGRMIVPYFGGAIHVWLTCVMFFQVVLLCGYFYSHFFAKTLGKWHLIILLFPLLNLPFHVNAKINLETPIATLISLLFANFALPFFILSTTAVIAQLWLTMSEVGESNNPYTLYAASNAGSFIGLFGYPLIIEPLMGVRMQCSLWVMGYLFYGLIVLLAWFSLKPRHSNHLILEGRNHPLEDDRPKIKDYIIWLTLSCLPSAFFLSVTNYIALEIGSFSLVWITPLGLYLASFIITFRENGGVPKFLNLLRTEVILLGLIIYLIPLVNWYLIIGHIITLLIICVISHGELYNRKPSVQYLTNFYLAIAIGGGLGGIFVSIIAPNIFSGLYEYPLVVLSIGIALLLLYFSEFKNYWRKAHIIVAMGRLLPIALMLAIIITGIKSNLKNEIKYKRRNFYGTYRIRDDQSFEKRPEPIRKLIHGATLHGSQFTKKELQQIPTSYYYVGGNIENVYSIIKSPRNIAVLGLGAGTTAAYGRSGDSMTFYEIDPDNEQIARTWFTYLKDSQAKIKVITGDGRIALQSRFSGQTRYSLIHVDAFTGDGIPIHLLTREAIQIYLQRLTEKGIILFHISNRYYDLAPIIISTSFELGLCCVKSPEILKTSHKWTTPSICVAASRKKESILPLIESGWTDIKHEDFKDRHVRSWTDDYINPLKPLIFKLCNDNKVLAFQK